MCFRASCSTRSASNWARPSWSRTAQHGGTIGTAAVARADPDGYTLLATSSAHTITPAIYPKLSYDTGRDLAAVVSMGQTPLVMIMAPSKGHKTVQDFVKAAKDKSGSANFATAGVGSATHLAAERFIASAGIKATHIPFRGGAEALTEIVAGRIDFYFCPLGTALPQIREGRVLALAISSPTRTASLPDTPSTLEAGYPNSDYTFWVGVFAPVKTPAAIVERLHGETQKAMQVAENVEAAAQRARLRPDEPVARGIRGAGAKGIRHQRRACQGGRPETELTITGETPWTNFDCWLWPRSACSSSRCRRRRRRIPGEAGEDRGALRARWRTDIVARICAEQLRQILGHSLVVETSPAPSASSPSRNDGRTGRTATP